MLGNRLHVCWSSPRDTLRTKFGPWAGPPLHFGKFAKTHDTHARVAADAVVPQGWTPDFVAQNVDRNIYDEIVPVTDDEAIATSLKLAKHEGILCGISAGGTFAAALKACSFANAQSSLPELCRYFMYWDAHMVHHGEYCRVHCVRVTHFVHTCGLLGHTSP